MRTAPRAVTAQQVSSETSYRTLPEQVRTRTKRRLRSFLCLLRQADLLFGCVFVSRRLGNAPVTNKGKTLDMNCDKTQNRYIMSTFPFKSLAVGSAGGQHGLSRYTEFRGSRTKRLRDPLKRRRKLGHSVLEGRAERSLGGSMN